MITRFGILCWWLSTLGAVAAGGIALIVETHRDAIGLIGEALVMAAIVGCPGWFLCFILTGHLTRPPKMPT